MFGKLFKSDDDKPTAAKRKVAANKKAAPRERAKPTRVLRERIDVSDLRVGMFVVELDKPWEESPFMFQGLEIKSPSDIAAVQKECSFVWVDYDKFQLQKSDKTKSTGPAAGAPAKASEVSSVEDEMDHASEVHSLATETIGTLFEEIRLGAEIDGGKVKQAVNGCVDSILRNPDASVWLTRIQAKHAGTAHHSLNVAALSIVMGKAMGMSPREMEDLGVCGMLHDVGKTSISTDILNKTGPLTDEEYAEIQKHTRYGRDILMSTKSVMSGAADVAHSHHERIDGTGYPRRLNSETIPVYSRIVAITEAYDVMTTSQTYREASSPSEALQELYSKRGTQFDEELVIKFIEAVGIFPPGSVVEMVNGEIGIVLANTNDKLRPRVIIILDPEKEPTPQRVVDLSQMDVDQNGNAYQIKTTHRDGSFGIDVADFQRAGLRLG